MIHDIMHYLAKLSWIFENRNMLQSALPKHVIITQTKVNLQNQVKKMAKRKGKGPPRKKLG